MAGDEEMRWRRDGDEMETRSSSEDRWVEETDEVGMDRRGRGRISGTILGAGRLKCDI